MELRVIADVDAMRQAAVGERLGVERRYGETSTIASSPQALEGLGIAEAFIAACRSGNIVQLNPISPMTQREGPTD